MKPDQTASGQTDPATGAPAASKPAVHPAESPSTSPPAATNPPKPEEQLRLTFVGDVLLASTVENVLKLNGFDYPYREVKSQLSQADLTIANFESPVTERGTEQQKEYTYRTSPKALPAFTEAGFDIVNLANNHVMDYGEEGLLDTLTYLSKSGVQTVGAGHDADEAFKPVIVSKNGIRVAFLGFSHVVPTGSWKAGIHHPGVADTYAEKRPLEAIKQAKSMADMVVVLVHWGVERKDKPEAWQTKLGHHYIDAGADLVIGSHPHVLQGFENYKGKWIAYSLGNFIFTTNNVPATLETIILDASCSKTGACDLRATPIYTKYAKPVVMEADAGHKLMERLSSISFGAGLGPDGMIKTLTNR
jgi:poly-gamma-glutamate synthesis protein (capsule biosynthesis protein)